MPEKWAKILLQSIPFSNIIKNDKADIYIEQHNNNYARIYIKNYGVSGEVINIKYLIFRIFVEIEELFFKKISCNNDKTIALHGGGIIYKDRGILVIQNKGAGKTTLIAKMSSLDNVQYLADDLIICDGTKVQGVALPMRLRNISIDGLMLNGKIVTKCFDFNDQYRYIYKPNCSHEIRSVPIGCFVLPDYSANNENKIVELKGKDKINEIIKQTKKTKSLKNLFLSVLNFKNIPVYKLKYNDLAIIESFLNKKFKKDLKGSYNLC
ncbi:hypothetical protein [Natronospora cellulosivora (SeqCode)]